MKYAIGVDIGGTKVAIGMVDDVGEVVEHSVIPTDLSITPAEMIDRIKAEINQLVERSRVAADDITGIGIGCPGPLDSKAGMITNPPNLHGWVDVPIKKWVGADFPYPVSIENDANAAALAEKWLGSGQGNDNFVYMTVSTGIGSGVIADGKLLHGKKGNAGDIGHTVVDPSFGECTCGQYGCLELAASGTAIARQGSDIMGRDLSTKEVFDLYAEGHPEISELIGRVFRVLGVACVTLINTFDTEKIIIGGGVSKVGDVMFQSIREYVSKYALNPAGRATEIVPAGLDQQAGVVGAAALCLDIS